MSENNSNSSNILNTLGLCRRAGKIVTGFDAVVADIRNAAGVMVTVDLSEKSKKEITFHCDKSRKQVIEIPHTMEEIQNIFGKKTGIIAILDRGFFRALQKKILRS
ncbi:MAG: 50S ribosomal protein L7 [Oscillospiraceae bacterium]|nr:50S ribosomal protein L7 [Oscillospiraceae bacterium]